MNKSFSDSDLSAKRSFSESGLSAERSQHIVLKLDTHNVPLNIPASQEPLYRDAATFLNERYHYYQRIRPSATIEEIWLYVALETAVTLQSGVRKSSSSEIDKRASVLNQLINKELKS